MQPIRKLQLRLLSMLDVLDNICSRCGLRYYLIGGSALGAVRHKGFIPWDDDIDIALERKAFERLEAELPSFLPDGFIYMPVENHLYPEAPIGYFIDISDRTIPPPECPKIDIFALDGVPESPKLQRKQQFYSLLYHLAIYRSPARNRGKAAHFMTAAILKLTPKPLLDHFCRKSKRVISQWDTEKCEKWVNLFGMKHYRGEIMPKIYYGTPRMLEFEGRLLPVPYMYHEYLTHLYGDYMTPPPESERTAQHSARAGD